MEVLRVGFVGTRTSNVTETAYFFRDLFGLDVIQDDSAWSILRLPTGRLDLFEIYASEFDDDRLAPPQQPLFVSFVVTDLQEAREEIKAAGHDVGEVVWASEAFGDSELAGFGWFFFRAPDELTYVVQQIPE